MLLRGWGRARTSRTCNVTDDDLDHTCMYDRYLIAGANNTIRVEFASKVLEAAARASACTLNNSIICPRRVVF
jgi:hypothetical protein